MRHGIAEDASPRTGFRDAPRELTPEGAARMRAAADGMAALGIDAEVVLTSPLLRCRQTAEIVCARLGGAPVEDGRLCPGMDLDALEDALLAHPDAGKLLVCGHEPDLSEAVAGLTGGGLVEFRKGSLALLDVAAVRPAGGRLRALYPPSALRRLGAS
ncbi:MAG: histidine phosphatase family protein [Thermoleophilia bacterium]